MKENRKKFDDGTIAVWHEPILKEMNVEDVQEIIQKLDKALNEQKSKKANYLLTGKKQ